MKTAFNIWLRAHLIYFTVMLLALAAPPIFLIGMGLAWLWSLPALPVFLLLVWLLRLLPLSRGGFLFLTLTGAVLICFGATYGAAWQFSEGVHVWKNYCEWCLFPLLGMAATTAAVLSARRKLLALYEERQLLTDAPVATPSL